MIVVVGGGISGLSTAWYLSRAGLECTLVEKQPRLGGVIETGYHEGCVLEGGPDSFLAAKPEALQLIKELGLEDEVISSNDHQRVTYIWKNRRMIPLPDGLMMMVPTRIAPMVTTPLLSWRTKVRMGLEYFHRPPGDPHERTVSEFISEHYGQETVDYLAEPLLSGVYGGSPQALSADSVLTRFLQIEKKYGSLTRGVLAMRRSAKSGESGPLFRSMKRGLGSMVEALRTQIGGRMRVIQGDAESLERADAGCRVRINGEWIPAAHAVLALPAYASARLLEAEDGELARLLNTIDYGSSMTVTLVYKPGNLDHNTKGFGFLVPRKDVRFVRACTWAHRKFPHRAPEGWSIVRCFLGGKGNEAVLDLSDTQVLAGVLGDLANLMGTHNRPDFHRITRWRKGMAQYTLGHAHRTGQIRARLAAFPNLHLAGNYFGGIGIPDCIQTGKAAAEKIRAAAC